MAKIRPKVPGGPGGPNDPDITPGRGGKKPFRRKPYLKDIGEIIVAEWKRAAAAGEQMDRERLYAALEGKLQKAGSGTHGAGNPNRIPVEFDVVVDPMPMGQTTKFVWIAIPAPEPPGGMTVSDWVNQTYTDEEDLADLGEAVLFGCGR